MGHSPWGHKSVRHNLVTKQQAAIRFCACHFAICLCLSLSYTRRYFSKLFHYIISDLESENKYSKFTLGVDSTNIRNQEMYKKWGFDIREGVTSVWTYPDGRTETIIWFEKIVDKKISKIN